MHMLNCETVQSKKKKCVKEKLVQGHHADGGQNDAGGQHEIDNNITSE